MTLRRPHHFRLTVGVYPPVHVVVVLICSVHPYSPSDEEVAVMPLVTADFVDGEEVNIKTYMQSHTGKPWVALYIGDPVNGIKLQFDMDTFQNLINAIWEAAVEPKNPNEVANKWASGMRAATEHYSKIIPSLPKT